MSHVLFTSNLKVLGILRFGMGSKINKEYRVPEYLIFFGFSPYLLKFSLEAGLEVEIAIFGGNNLILHASARAARAAAQI